MGSRMVTVSDRTGKVLDDKNKVSIVVRSHPELPEGKAKIIDVHRSELNKLECTSDDVHLEITQPDGRKASISCTAEEFEEFFDSDQLKEADWNRGRRSGFSPNLQAVGE